MPTAESATAHMSLVAGSRLAKTHSRISAAVPQRDPFRAWRRSQIRAVCRMTARRTINWSCASEYHRALDRLER